MILRGGTKRFGDDGKETNEQISLAPGLDDRAPHAILQTDGGGATVGGAVVEAALMSSSPSPSPPPPSSSPGAAGAS